MMRNILIIGAILFAGVLFGQTKKNVSKTWENRDSEIAQKVFSKYQEKENNKFEFSHILGKVKFTDNKYEIYIGNIKVCDLSPQIFEMMEAQNKIKMIVDEKEIETSFANEIDIKNDFKILESELRANIIGFSKNGVDSEDDILIKKDDIQDIYSLDTNKSKYRAEFYKDDKFIGMIVLNFIK